MMSIRYNPEVDMCTPDLCTYNIAAKELFRMCVKDADEKIAQGGEIFPGTETFVVDPELDKLTSLKELCAVLALSFDELELGAMTFDTYPSWTVMNEPVKSAVSVSTFLDVLFEHGLDAVKTTPSRLLQMASRTANATKKLVIEDADVFAAACNYYASFDERFQTLFYPSSYCLDLTSDSAPLFELSAAIAKGISLTKIYDITPTSMWLSMLVQEPVPSLLYDFLAKTHQSTSVSEEGIEKMSADTGSMSELCHLYVDEFMPVTPDMEKATFSDSFLLLVSNVVSSCPATINDVVRELMKHHSTYRASVPDWDEYCKCVVDSCDFSDVPMVYYPDVVTLDAGAMDAASKLLRCEHAPLRRLIASSALVSFLDESLEGGAPDFVRLTVENLAAGAKAMELDGSFLPVDSPIPEADIRILMESRKLSHFGVPMLFQQLMIGHMISRRASMVDITDIAHAVTPSSDLRLLSDDVSPYTAHAGVEFEAARVLAVAEAVMRRMTMSLVMDSKSALRMYSSLLATAMAAYSVTPDDCCTDTDQWLISASSSVFDPRIHVFYPPVEQQQTLSWTIPLGAFPQGGESSSQTNETFNRQSNPIPTLSALGTDMVALARAGEIGQGIVGRDDTIRLVETVLTRRDKSNPLLLAPAGAGKSAIVEGIAARIANGESELLHGYGLYQIDLTDLTADGCSTAVMADRLEKIVKEAISANIILFIDEVHMICSFGSGEINVGNIMKPYLARGGLKLIGATTEREYNYTIAKDRALARRFSALHLPALGFDALMNIVKEKQKVYGTHHGVAYEDKVARTIILLAESYMSDRESPDRELDILDTSASVANRDKEQTVGENQIVEAVRLLTSNRSVKTAKDVAKDAVKGDYTSEELDEMFPRVAGQKGAKEKIARRISESKLGLSARNKPRNIFMFVGESGVGKTYMANEMASLLEADSSDVLTLNLGEYQDRVSYSRLLGAAPQYVGYHEGGVLSNFVKAHPHGIVVLDEFDKGYPELQQMFLGIFDSGETKAGDGSHVDFRSITFVCTANTGFGDTKKNTLGFASVQSAEEEELNNAMEALTERFGAPFVNRLDEIVLFEKLTDDDMKEICRISYCLFASKFEERYGVELSRGYSEEQMMEDVEKKLVEEGGFGTNDARTVWSEFEKKAVAAAMELLDSAD